MGLFDFLNKKKDTRKKPATAWANVFLRDIGLVAWDDARESYWVEEGFKRNPTVQAIVNQTTKAAGSIPWVCKDKRTGKIIKNPDPVLKQLMYKPNDRETWNDFVQETIGFKLLNGNAFLWGIYPNNPDSLNAGTYQYIYNLPSHLVQIYSDGKLGISHYNMDYRWTNDPIDAKDVYHIKTFNPDYDETGSFLYGQSPLESCRRSIDVNNQCIDAMQALMSNLGPPGILGMKGEGAEEFDEIQQRKVKQQLKSGYQGAVNFGDFPVNNMEWVWTQLGSDPSKLMIMEKYEKTKTDICNAYGFPKTLLNADANYANQNEAKRMMWENVVIPNLIELRDALNCWLVPQFGDNIMIDYDTSNVKALQQDFDTQANSVLKLQGVLSVNELRDRLGYEPIEGGDEIMPNNFATNFGQSVIGGSTTDQETSRGEDKDAGE